MNQNKYESDHELLADNLSNYFCECEVFLENENYDFNKEEDIHLPKTFSQWRDSVQPAPIRIMAKNGQPRRLRTTKNQHKKCSM